MTDGHGFTFGRLVEDDTVRLILLRHGDWSTQLDAQAVAALIEDLTASLDLEKSVSGQETDMTAPYPPHWLDVEDVDELDPRLSDVLEAWQPDEYQKRETLEVLAKYAARDPGFAPFFTMFCDRTLEQRDMPQRFLALSEIVTALLIGSIGEKRTIGWLVAAAGEEEL